MFSTASDNQKQIEIHVLQGESGKVLDNQTVGYVILKNIREAKRGEPKINVVFDANADGLLTVSGTDRDTKAAQTWKAPNPLPIEKW